jgi:acetolactate synthase-1/2/3 large subunit
MNISVSELIVRYLEQLGIDHIFGMPGAHVLPIYDRLHDSSVKSVLVKHEQGAAFMAGGHARVSGRPSACIATAGPGATNLITGIANAYAERLPVLAITGETSTYIFGRGGLQESSGEGGAIDQGALFASITRYHRLVERTDYLGQVLNQATQALLGREPGPVLLSIPYNVQKEMVDDSALRQIHFPRRSEMPPATPVAELADLLRTARYPVIVAGYGCIQAGAREVVAALSERFGIPVTTSLKAKGVVAEGTPLSLGCLGVTSNGAASRYLADHADLLVFLGAGFNERTSYLWDTKLLANKKIAQVDRDPAQLGRVFQPDVAICDDILTVMEDLVHTLEADGMPPKRLDRLDRHRAALAGKASDDTVAQDGAFRLMRRFFDGLAKTSRTTRWCSTTTSSSRKATSTSPTATTTSRIPASRRSATRSPPPSARAASRRTAPPSPSSATAASRCAAWK